MAVAILLLVAGFRMPGYIASAMAVPLFKHQGFTSNRIRSPWAAWRSHMDPFTSQPHGALGATTRLVSVSRSITVNCFVSSSVKLPLPSRRIILFES
jgi:hypothetical protein